MAMVTITSSSGTNISGNLSFENRNSLREPSFSSYLDSAEETFVLQLAKSSRNLHSFSSIPKDPLHLGRKKTEYGEIDVFSAEKYFNGGVDEGTPKVVHNSAPILQNNNDHTLEIASLKQKIRPATPSVRSESSWNSRSSLLQIPRDQQPRKANSIRSKSFFASLGCNYCSCNDKDSVNVDNQISEGKAKELFKNGNLSHFKKSHSNTWLKEDRQCKRFGEERRGMSTQDVTSFPALNSVTGNANKLPLQEEEEDTRRKSLEVFGSPVPARGEKSLSPEKQIKMLAWDAIPPREVEIEIPASFNGKYDDTGSDASSDLFEIESFSSNVNPYLARQASDGMSSCVTPTCYAPSEASIEWSTVTASAADFSVMSDSEELSTTRTSLHRMVLDGKNVTGKEMPKRRPSILSGCKSQKAVRVAGEAYRISDKACPDLQRHQRLEPLKPMTRFHTDRKLDRFDTRNGQRRFEALSESQFKRAPHLLSMH